jgi:hypothetical protein
MASETSSGRLLRWLWLTSHMCRGRSGLWLPASSCWLLLGVATLPK